jgi:hypothetical protein
MRDGTGDWRLMGCSAEDLHRMMAAAVEQADRPTFRVVHQDGHDHEQPDRPLDSTAEIFGWTVDVVPPAGSTWMMHLLERVFGVAKETNPEELDGRIGHLIEWLTDWRSDLAARQPARG